MAKVQWMEWNGYHYGNTSVGDSFGDRSYRVRVCTTDSRVTVEKFSQGWREIAQWYCLLPVNPVNHPDEGKAFVEQLERELGGIKG